MAPKATDERGVAGDPASARLTRLYEEHGREVLAYALRRASPEDAADAVAETFLVAWRRLPDVPPGEASRPWLCGVARRVLANQARGERRRGLLAERLRRELEIAGPEPGSEADGDSPDSPALDTLAGIDETDREILRLVALEGLTPQQAGRAIGIPATTARSRLHRARRRARAALAAVAALGLIAAFLVATPPGQAVAAWIGERFGIGQPGGPPAQRELREFAVQGSVAEGRPAYVLVRGPAPYGHYEFVSHSLAPGAAPAGGLGSHCFELHLSDPRGFGTQGCAVLPGGADLYVHGIGGASYRNRDVDHLAGRASPEVSRVEVSFDGAEVPVELTEVPAEVRRRAGIGVAFKFFVAFPPAREGGTAVVTAYDGEGEVLARERTVAFDRTGAMRELCEAMRRESRRLPPDC